MSPTLGTIFAPISRLPLVVSRIPGITAHPAYYHRLTAGGTTRILLAGLLTLPCRHAVKPGVYQRRNLPYRYHLTPVRLARLHLLHRFSSLPPSPDLSRRPSPLASIIDQKLAHSSDVRFGAGRRKYGPYPSRIASLSSSVNAAERL